MTTHNIKWSAPVYGIALDVVFSMRDSSMDTQRHEFLRRLNIMLGRTGTPLLMEAVRWACKHREIRRLASDYVKTGDVRIVEEAGILRSAVPTLEAIVDHYGFEDGDDVAPKTNSSTTRTRLAGDISVLCVRLATLEKRLVELEDRVAKRRATTT